MTSQDTYKRCLTAEQERMGERTIKLRKKLIWTKQNIDCEMTTKAKTYDNYTIERKRNYAKKTLTEYKLARKHDKRTKRM